MRLAVAVGVFATLGVALGGQTHAFYGNGAQIVSAHFGRLEQADDASQSAAISADGRYVAFQTRARNFFADGDPDPPGQYRRGGIFRFDLQTQAIELVAAGDLLEEDTDSLVLRGAQNPSISGDGRFVAFSTAQQLVPADTNAHIDVYVRDMSLAAAAPNAFDLVSARDGGDVAASYLDPATQVKPGAEVSRGAAISTDGQSVVFGTMVASDLPAAAGLSTPAFQVFHRDRVDDRTTLVTRAMASGDPAGGALGEAGISGDGTTVVWTGQNARLQTRFLPGEPGDNGFNHYLWRRVADGPDSDTRRITGVADVDDPACPPGGVVSSDPTAVGPCFGPLTNPEHVGASISSQLPAISSDGRRIAFVTGSGPRPNNTTGVGLDVYVTDMAPGVSRKASTVELTRDIPEDLSASGGVDSIALSPEGRFLAITTTRTRFVLPTLRFTRSPRPFPTARELYVIDLADRTIERATFGIDGSDINGPISPDPSISRDGARVAFVAAASNLFVGDANERADVFAVTRQPEPQPGPPPGGAGTGGGVDSGEEQLGGDVDRVLSVRVRSLGRGIIELRVRVPAAGTVTASARARLAAQRRRRAALRTLARATRFSPRAGRVTLRLRLVRRYRSVLRRRGKLVARAHVTFAPSRGGPRRSARPRVTFRAERPQRAGNRK
jgi:WD40-like Beta Propeller Repeat